jgi:hypothetical protein
MLRKLFYKKEKSDWINPHAVLTCLYLICIWSLDWNEH